jgi:hypothetical protein
MTARSAGEACFIVTSAGRAATYWLSHLLNRCDDVFCKHGYFPADELPPGEKNAPDDFGEGGYEIGNIHKLDGNTANAAALVRTDATYIARFNAMTIDEYFASLKARYRVRAYGNVHGFTQDSIIRKARVNRPETPFSICNLTRHPVSRVQSFYRRFAHMEQWLPESARRRATRKSHARLLRDNVRARFGIDLYDDAFWLFRDSMMRMLVQYKEATVPGMPQVMSEAITTDKAQFRALFADLTDGRLELPEEILDDATFARRLNRSQDRPETPESVFAAWEPWQRFVFRALIRPEWLQGYAKVGYDISFIAGTD